MKNMVLGLIIGGLVVGLVTVVAWAVLGKPPAVVTPDNALGTPPPSAYPVQPNISPSPSVTPTQELSGNVTGKLCYPSSFLPKGQIEAKHTTTNTVLIQEYPGSQNGGKSTYAFELPAGTYILRYEAQVDANNALYGYHTTTCPTGLETSCAATNSRTNIQVPVKAGSSVVGVDLCDFYYDQQNPPTF